MWLEILLILFLVLLNGLFAMGEMALVSARPARLAVLVRKGLKGAEAARRLAAEPQHFLPTVQLGVTLVGILTGVVGGAHLTDSIAIILERAGLGPALAENLALLLVVVFITYFTLVLGELVPKQLALRRPERIAAALAPALGRLTRASTPVVWLLGRSSRLVLALARISTGPRPGMTEEELKAFLHEGTEAGVLESEEREMIERLLRLADRPVRAIMTPRTEIAWIDRTDPPREIAAALKSAPHSRFVVSDGAVDNVVGIVQAKDILDRLLDGGDLSLTAALRTPIIVPDTASALDVLERLKTDPLGIALVLDEYGSFEGMVTAADVLSAIVGEGGERTRADAHATAPDPGPFDLEGAMAIDELKSRLALPEHLPAEGSYHTLGGLLLALLRRVPRAGDTIVFAGWRFEVTTMDNRRVATVRAARDAPAADTAAIKT